VKKLMLFLLMGLVTAGLVMAAAPAHPPGAPAIVLMSRDTLAVLPGYGVHEAAVTPDTVPAPLFWALPAGFLAGSAQDESPGQPRRYSLSKPIDTGQGVITAYREPPDYWLRV
jgi:hypothetical protein